jgi:hypothetical protein
LVDEGKFFFTTDIQLISVEFVRNEIVMEEAERQLKHQHRVYCLGKNPAEGVSSKTARVHC